MLPIGPLHHARLLYAYPPDTALRSFYYASGKQSLDHTCPKRSFAGVKYCIFVRPQTIFSRVIEYVTVMHGAMVCVVRRMLNVECILVYSPTHTEGRVLGLTRKLAGSLERVTIALWHGRKGFFPWMIRETRTWRP